MSNISSFNLIILLCAAGIVTAGPFTIRIGLKSYKQELLVAGILQIVCGLSVVVAIIENILLTR